MGQRINARRGRVERFWIRGNAQIVKGSMIRASEMFSYTAHYVLQLGRGTFGMTIKLPESVQQRRSC